MKKITIILIIWLVAVSVSAQHEGSIRYLCTSNWSKMLSKIEYISKEQRDRNMYVWGARSDWKEYMVLHFNQNSSKYVRSDEIAEDDYYPWSSREKTYFFYNNFENRTMHYAFPLLDKSYIVTDSIQIPVWKIKNDMKEIGGHICMNAETTDKMRDQTINAWFALDIPVSSGPERFIGLPGMILEVDINDGAVIMTADKIDLKKLTSELDIPAKIKGRKIHYAELENIFLKKIDESKKNEEPWFFWLPY